MKHLLISFVSADLLNGAGKFQSTTYMNKSSQQEEDLFSTQAWKVKDTKLYSNQIKDDDDNSYLELSKQGSIAGMMVGRFSFNDALQLQFDDSKPQHLSFKVQVGNTTEFHEKPENKNQVQLGLEACDLRLTSLDDTGEVKENSDVVFYRMGIYKYHKLNMHDQLMRYEPNQWYDVDILIDWDDKQEDKQTK